MSNVDRFIKYLSDELDLKESEALERDLASDPRLKKEFEKVSAAYRLIGEELQRRDLEAFRKKLSEAMDEQLPGDQKANRRKRYFSVLLPLAASLAILLVLFIRKGENEHRIVSRFLHPEEDPVVLALQHGTRGAEDRVIHLYREGKYQESLAACIHVLEREADNQKVILFFLLSSLELGEEKYALERLPQLSSIPGDQLGRSILWYSSLALLRSGEKEEALLGLDRLIEQQGPYRKEAEKLKKALLK